MSMQRNKHKLITLMLIITTSWFSSAYGNVFVNPKSSHLNFYLGNFDADQEAGILENPSSNIAIGLASSSQSRQYPHLAFDLELWVLSSEFANTLPPPLFVSVNDEMELETTAITAGARLLYPYDTPYRFYLSGGYGYFYSSMRVYANLLGIPGYFEDTSREFAPYFGAGFTYHLGYRQTIEIFYRKWDVDGDFSRFLIPETGIGGEAIGIGFGMIW